MGLTMVAVVDKTRQNNQPQQGECQQQQQRGAKHKPIDVEEKKDPRH
jgi:hypothetical protein